MSDGTAIEWTDATWNPVTGCSVVSPGCTNCYAMRLAGTRLRNHPTRIGLTRDTKAGPVWTGDVRFNERALTEPLRWTKPRMIFVCAHGDLFHENVPDEWIDRIFAVMALCPQHTFQVLTKRSARMRAYTAGAKDRILRTSAGGHENVSVSTAKVYLSRTVIGGRRTWPLPNVWLGVSTEDQTRADERIPDLLATPASVRWVSAEPLLGPIDFRRIRITPDHHTIVDSLEGYYRAVVAPGQPPGYRPERTMIDWIVAGDESGPNRRAVDLDDVRSIRDQCAATGTSFFLKQLHIGGKKVGLPALDGRQHDAMPQVSA